MDGDFLHEDKHTAKKMKSKPGNVDVQSQSGNSSYTQHDIQQIKLLDDQGINKNDIDDSGDAHITITERRCSECKFIATKLTSLQLHQIVH